MSWFRIDDGFAFHHKTVAAGNAAVGLWVRAGSWSSGAKMGGYIPGEMVRALGNRAQSQRLVTAGLWIPTDGGYQFHEWDDHNPTAHEAKTAHKKQSQAGKLGNHRKWHVKRGIVDPDCLFCETEQ